MRELVDYNFEFGPFELQPNERRLLREGQLVPLTPKAFDTLVLLVERAGHLVEKEELMKALWPDTFVEEANLAQHVWTLRKTLGESEGGSSFIETVPKKGFRFIANVKKNPLAKVEAKEEFEDRTQTFSSGAVPQDIRTLPGPKITIFVLSAVVLTLVGYSVGRRKAGPVAPMTSIAVLPFQPLSADSRNESLEMGMTETLITHLSNLREVVVRPMSAVRRYTDPQQDPAKIGQELQTDAVLDGSIQKVGDRVRVTVRLTNVRNGSSLWAQQFDESFTDIFKVQDSISQRVANTLPLKLDQDEQARLTKRYTNSPEAYDLYLQAQYLSDNRTPENRQKMFQYYEQAIAKDPNFALAYVGLADLQITLVGDNQIAYEDIKPKIMDNLTKALQLDESLAQAINLLAEVKYQFDFDWVEAEKQFKKAIELNGNVASIRLAYGWFLMSLGRFDEAGREMQRAQELDPHSKVISRSRGRLLCFMGKYDEAIQHMQRIVSAEPNVSLNYWVLSNAYELKGMYAEVLDADGKAAMIEGVRPERVEKFKETFRVSGWNGYLQERKDRLMKNKEGYVSAMRIAAINARLGNKDEALTWLDKAVDERSSGIPHLKVDPLFENLRSDPRFAKLLRRMNITP